MSGTVAHSQWVQCLDIDIQMLKNRFPIFMTITDQNPLIHVSRKSDAWTVGGRKVDEQLHFQRTEILCLIDHQMGVAKRLTILSQNGAYQQLMKQKQQGVIFFIQ